MSGPVINNNNNNNNEDVLVPVVDATVPLTTTTSQQTKSEISILVDTIHGWKNDVNSAMEKKCTEHKQELDKNREELLTEVRKLTAAQDELRTEITTGRHELLGRITECENKLNTSLTVEDVQKMIDNSISSQSHHSLQGPVVVAATAPVPTPMDQQRDTAVVRTAPVAAPVVSTVPVGTIPSTSFLAASSGVPAIDKLTQPYEPSDPEYHALSQAFVDPSMKLVFDILLHHATLTHTGVFATTLMWQYPPEEDTIEAMPHNQAILKVVSANLLQLVMKYHSKCENLTVPHIRGLLRKAAEFNDNIPNHYYDDAYATFGMKKSNTMLQGSYNPNQMDVVFINARVFATVLTWIPTSSLAASPAAYTQYAMYKVDWDNSIFGKPIVDNTHQSWLMRCYTRVLDVNTAVPHIDGMGFINHDSRHQWVCMYGKLEMNERNKLWKQKFHPHQPIQYYPAKYAKLLQQRRERDINKNQGGDGAVSKATKRKHSDNNSVPVAKRSKPLETEKDDTGVDAAIVTNINEPIEDADQPIEDADQPIEDADQPIEDADQPIEDADQPIEDADEPIEDADEPIKDVDEESSNDNEESCDGDEDSTSESASASDSDDDVIDAEEDTVVTECM